MQRVIYLGSSTPMWRAKASACDKSTPAAGEAAPRRITTYTKLEMESPGQLERDDGGPVVVSRKHALVVIDQPEFDRRLHRGDQHRSGPPRHADRALSKGRARGKARRHPWNDGARTPSNSAGGGREC